MLSFTHTHTKQFIRACSSASSSVRSSRNEDKRVSAVAAVGCHGFDVSDSPGEMSG
jgi:hypothetical protein